MDLKLLVLILPLVFMFHDFEEIIFFKKWFKNNKDNLLRRFPKIATKILPHFENISTASFSLAVAEEFILLSAISVYAVYNEIYLLWYGIFIGFFIHIIIHIIQWIIYRRYIPCIVTSFLVLPYCIYTFVKINEWEIFTVNEQVIWGLLGFIIIVLNLLLAHKLIANFDKWLKN
ncbi:MAG: HXXEE domain-containing protein [Agriterribacter sp.]